MSSICLPEHLQHEDARSWSKRFAAANEWNVAKQLLHLPTLLRGRSWAVYESLRDADKESYDKLKKAILDRLDPDTDEHRLAACDQLSQTHLREGLESIDKLARDLEKLLDQASPGLPATTREAELHFHLINSLPDNVAFQLKLQPQANYSATIAKARELQLIYVQPEQQHHQRSELRENRRREPPGQSGAVTTTNDGTVSSPQQPLA